jgi:hypothetical protein
MREFPAGMTTAPGRGGARTQARAGLSLALALAAAPACKLNQQGVPPPLDRISFPASALVDPDGLWLYVANSNSDLRYNDGTLVAVDLDAAVRDRFGAMDYNPIWPVCPGADRVRPDAVDVGRFPADAAPCCWDYLDHGILNCDERLYIPPSSTVKIGSFSAGMQFQTFTESMCGPDKPATYTGTDRHACNPNCPSEPVGGRLFIGVRGNSSLTYVDTSRVYDQSLQLPVDPAVAAARMMAGQQTPGRERPVFSCSDPHGTDPNVCTVTQTPQPSSPGNGEQPIHVPDEPYALALDESADLLYVGNLRGDTMHPQTGGISLFDVSRPTASVSDVPRFIAATGSFFNPDVNNQFGITSLTLRRNGHVYACSRYGTNSVDVQPALSGLCNQDPGTISLVMGSDVFTTPLLGQEIRGIQFLPDPNGVPAEGANQASRAFVLQRTPPGLVEFDASTDQRAFGNFPSKVLETCAGPTFLQAYDAGEGTRLYVTCFDQGQIYVFDPYVPRLISVINAGRGPAGLAFPRTFRGDRPERLAYVVGFAANDVPVLDLTPGSATQYHVVQRIGFPSPVPR